MIIVSAFEQQTAVHDLNDGRVLGPPMYPLEVEMANKAKSETANNDCITTELGTTYLSYGPWMRPTNRLQGLVADTPLVYKQGRYNTVWLVRSQNATYMNELAPALGIDPSTSFSFASCKEGEDLGVIPSSHYIWHLARGEAPLSITSNAGNGRDFISHDHLPDDHKATWWTIPLEGRHLIMRLSAHALELEQVEALPFAIDKHMDEIASAVDSITSEFRVILEPARINSDRRLHPLTKDLQTVGMLLAPSFFDERTITSSSAWLRLRLLEKHPDLIEKLTAGRKLRELSSPKDRLWAARMWKEQVRHSTELQLLAEQMRPDFSAPAWRRIGRRMLLSVFS